jgi:Protein of unknown function (DUF2934)
LICDRTLELIRPIEGFFSKGANAQVKIEFKESIFAMAKKQIISSEVSSAAGAAASPVRAEKTSKPIAKRATSTKHSATKTTAIAATPICEEAGAVMAPMTNGGIVEIEREEVAKLAYLYWEARGGQGGSPENDWIRAEEELKNRKHATASA